MRVLRVGDSDEAGFSSISDALAVASDGDEIVVEPGSYTETLRVESDVVISGEGPRSRVLIRAPADSAPVEAIEHAFDDHSPDHLFATVQIHDADAHISGFTVIPPAPGSYEHTTAVWVGGGSPTFEDLLIEGPESQSRVSSFVLRPGSSPTIRASEWANYLHANGTEDLLIEDSTIHGSNLGLYAPGAATLRGNRFEEAATIGGDPGLVALLEAPGSSEGRLGLLLETAGLHLEENEFAGGGVHLTGSSPATLAGNRFLGRAGSYAQVGVEVSSAAAVADINANRFTDMPLGVRVENGQDVSVHGNEFVDVNVAVAWYGEGLGSISDNEISGGVTGIAVEEGAPSVTGNKIEAASSQGIAVSSLTAPVIEGNSVCGSRTNLEVSTFAEPVIGENDICPDEGG